MVLPCILPDDTGRNGVWINTLYVLFTFAVAICCYLLLFMFCVLMVLFSVRTGRLGRKVSGLTVDTAHLHAHVFDSRIKLRDFVF